MTHAVLILVALLAIPDAPAKVRVNQPRMALDLVVTGPKESLPGDLVVLDSSNSQGVSAGGWFISPMSAAGRMLVVENGQKVVFATSQQGRYVFVYYACTSDGKTIRNVAHEVVVGNPGPPGPQPIPPGPSPPGPSPPNPPNPDKYGLSAFVVAQVAAVSDSDKFANAQKLATACDVVISQIGAGVLRTDKQIAAAFEQQLGDIPFATKFRWKGALYALADKFDALALTDPKDWMQAFTEVAAGLRKVQ